MFFNKSCISIFLVCILYLIPNAFSQTNSVLDSLYLQKEKLEKNSSYEQDSLYISTLNKIAYTYTSINSDSAFHIAEMAFRLSSKAGVKKEEADALKSMGIAAYLKTDFPKALQYYQQSLKLAGSINYLECVSANLNNIGVIYDLEKDYERAIDYFQQSLEVEEELKNERGIALSYNNIGNTYKALGKYDLALEQQFKSLKIQDKLNDVEGKAASYQNIGEVYSVQKRYKEAISCYMKSLELSRSIHREYDTFYPLNHIAKIYYEQGNYEEAERYGLDSYQIANSTNTNNEKRQASEILYLIYKKKGLVGKALEYHELFKAYSDSMYNDETRKKLIQLETSYEYEKKELLLTTAQREKDLQHQAEIDLRNNLIYLMAFLVLLTLFVIYITYYHYQSQKRVKKILLEKNEEITQKNNSIEQANKDLLLQNDYINTLNEELKEINHKLSVNEESLIKFLNNLQKKEKELQEYVKRIEQLNEYKDQLFFIIAHDLKGPINTIQTVLTLINEHVMSMDDLQKILPGVIQSVSYTAHLTEDLLVWAKSQFEDIRVEPIFFDFHPIVEKYISLFKMQTELKKIVIINSLPFSCKMFADQNMAELVIRNLMSNAIKFCYTGGRITISAKEKMQKWEVCVEDNGVGMSEELKNKLFTNERISLPGTNNEKGTGLGLKICKEFIEKNQGEFRIESEEGRGTKIYFSLPKQEKLLNLKVEQFS